MLRNDQSTSRMISRDFQPQEPELTELKNLYSGDVSCYRFNPLAKVLKWARKTTRIARLHSRRTQVSYEGLPAPQLIKLGKILLFNHESSCSYSDLFNHLDRYGKDQEEINRLIYEATKGTKYYEVCTSPSVYGMAQHAN